MRKTLLSAFVVAVGVVGAASPVSAGGNLTVAVIGCSGSGPYSCIGYDGGTYSCDQFVPSGGGGGVATGCEAT